MVDQQIVIEYIVQTQEALQKTVEYTLQTMRAGDAMAHLQRVTRDWGVSSVKSFKEAAAALKKLYAEQRMAGVPPLELREMPQKPSLEAGKEGREAYNRAKAEIKAINDELKAENKELVDDAKSDINEYKEAVNRALSEILKQEGQINRERLAQTRALTKDQIDQEKIRSKIIQDETRQIVIAAKDEYRQRISSAKEAAKSQLADAKARLKDDQEQLKIRERMIRDGYKQEIVLAREAYKQQIADAKAKEKSILADSKARLKAEEEQIKLRNKLVQDGYKQEMLQALEAHKLTSKIQGELMKGGGVPGGGLVENLEANKKRLVDVMNTIKTVSNQTGFSIREVGDAMKQMFAAQAMPGVKTAEQFSIAQRSIRIFSSDVDKATSSLKGTDRELKQKPGDLKGFMGALKSLGAVGQFVFGSVLGLSAVRILHSIIRWIGEASQAGIEFSQSLYKLTVSVHAMQRVGMDITMRETADQVVRLRKEFAFFTTRQIVDGVAYVQLLTRNFGFTEEKMQDVFKIASTLSVVLGKDFNEAARETALFLSSGYAESMQRAGLAVNRLTVTQEAARMGIHKSYMAMTEQERAAAALRLVMREMGPLFEDVGEYAKTSAGKIAAAKADIQEFKDSVGLGLNPLTEMWYEFWSFLARMVEETSLVINSAVDAMFQTLLRSFAQNFFMLTKIVEGGKEAIKTGTLQPLIDAAEFVGKNADDLGELWWKSFIDSMKKNAEEMGIEGLLGGDVEKGDKPPSQMGEDEEKKNELIKKIIKERLEIDEWYKEEKAKIEEESRKESEEAEKEHQEEMAEIDKKGGEKRLDIEKDFSRKLADIETDTQREIEDENRDYQRRLQEAASDERKDLAEAQENYREEELKAERDFIDKMRRLRDEYLFDLEDALRERDALQVLRLMRRYELDKKNLEEEKKNESEERRNDYQQELQDIRDQAAEKRAELAREHAQRLEDIQIQAQREREDAELARRQAHDDLTEDLAKERAELNANYDQEKLDRDAAKEQEIKDLDERFNERLAEIVLSLTEEEGMTNALLTKIVDGYKAAFGPNGEVDSAYDNFIKITNAATDLAQDKLLEIENLVSRAIAKAKEAQDALAATQAAVTAQQNLGVAGSQSATTDTSGVAGVPKNKALGGMEYANKPTWALFGEAGPEIANFTPINRLNTNNLGLPNPFYGGSGGGRSGGGGKVRIELAPGLIATIVDGALDQVADIYQGK